MCVMAEDLEYYDSGSVEGEDLEYEVLELPASLKMAQDAEADTMAEVGRELPVEIDEEPQPETEEKDLEVGAPGNVHLHVKPTSTSNEELPKESERDLPSETGPGMPQEAKSEILREMEGELFKELEVLVDDKEEPDLESPEEAKLEVTEDVLTESAEETDLELPKETGPDVSDSLGGTRLELLEQTILEVLEDSLKEQYEETGPEPPEQTKPEFPSEKPRKSIEEADLQPPKMTIPKEAQRKSPEEKGTEPSEQAKPEFPEGKPRETEETGLETPEETKPEVPREIQRKSTEKKETEPPQQTESEFPDQKPNKSSEETGRKSTEEKVPEPLKEIISEFPEEKSRKSIEETGLEPSGKTKPEAEEETLKESTVKKVLEPQEDIQPSDQKDKHRKSTEETGLAPPQKSKSEETVRESTEEKGLEPKFPKKEPRKSTEEIGQIPPPKTKPEVQEKIKTEETTEKDIELPDKAQLPLRIVSHTEFLKENRPKPVKFKYSLDKDEQEHSDYQTKWSVNETKKAKRESMFGSLTVSEVDSVSVSYEFSKDFKGLFEVTDINDDLYSYISDTQRHLKESFSEKVVDLSPELKQVHKDEETQPKESTELQFEYLKWSPEKVAEWISELGFPQYKECFTTNFICGRKLIHVNCSNLPQMGITDFEDMKKDDQGRNYEVTWNCNVEEQEMESDHGRSHLAPGNYRLDSLTLQ
ncbi:sterile alpha motif domain-containing protein 15 isoform X2 [Ailuropoda melanoleuca]|uniref:sterile alpha motif domain-containing protein 15 isoform X2 n=1 Tax=Ailuropoda melanoleuca TaxID=9646 RepID=UPI000947EB5E|nr:sterile alpha motif domain-containing protein 15 isoform X2 [Ailuropoda melanoleuca]